MRFPLALCLVSLRFLLVGCGTLSDRLIAAGNSRRNLFVRAPPLSPRDSRNVARSPDSRLRAEAQEDSAQGVQDTAKKIKLLRTSTGRGAQDCFKALNEANGDVRLASKILLDAMKDGQPRDEGSESDLVVMLQGTIAVSCSPTMCSIVDLRCDSDFVGKNSVFTALAKSFANAALDWRAGCRGAQKSPAELRAEVLARRCLRCGTSLADTGRLVQSSLREPMSVARVGFLEPGEDELVVFYVHSCLDPKHSRSFAGPSAAVLSFSLGDAQPEPFYSLAEEPVGESETNCCMLGSGCVYSRSPSLTDFQKEPEPGELRRLLRDLAVHVVAERPQDIDLESVDPDGLAESAREAEALLAAGKPPEVVDRIVRGKLKKKYGDSALMEQTWIFGSDSVARVLEDASKRLGRPIRLRRFLSYSVSDDLIRFRHPRGCAFYNTNIKF